MFQTEQPFFKIALVAMCVAGLYACGGGGGSTSGVVAEVGATQSSLPALAALVTLDDGTQVGATTFTVGAASEGGNGQPVQGLDCAPAGRSSSAFTYTHLNIVVDGQQVSVPDNIGIVPQGSQRIANPLIRQVGCFYPLLTTDSSGKIRIRPGNASPYTLGQFFAVWGVPLSASNTAGYSGKPVKAFIKNGTTLTEYTGDLGALPLISNQEVTLQIGTSLTQIPNFEWSNPPPLAATPTLVRHTMGGEAFNGNPGLEGNQTNGRGGQGGVVDGLACAGPLNQTPFEYIYHAHAHLAIYRDGVRLAIPQRIGIVGQDNVPTSTCSYALHSHDFTGTIHIEPTNSNTMTLGQFFNIWGQPLTRENVAGISRTPVVVYIRDGGNLRRFQGDPANIKLTSNRSIIIQLGTALDAVPAFELAEESQ